MYGPLTRDPAVSSWAAQFLDETPERDEYVPIPETIEQPVQVVPDEVLTTRGQAVVSARLLALLALGAGFAWRPAFLIGFGLGAAALALDLTGTTSKPQPAGE